MIPITDVFLYEDRSQIMRKGTISLKQGVNRIVLEDLSPLIVLKSVQTQLGTETAKLISMHTELTLVRDNRENHTIPKQKNEWLQEEYEAKNQAEKLKVTHSKTRELYERIVKEIFHNASWGVGSPNIWNKKESLLREKNRVAFEQTQDATSNYLNIFRRNEKNNIHRQPEVKYKKIAQVELEIHSEKEQEIEIQLDYLLGNACWRPAHRLEQIDDSQVIFSIGAMVWQNTGEDWKDAKLHFSTERSSLGTKAPPLTLDQLSLMETSKEIIIEEREQEVHQTGGDIKSISKMPGIDDGGEIRTLVAPKPEATIPSDGKPYFIEIETFSSGSKKEYLVISDQCPAAIIKTTQSNTSKLPILPGPVELLKNGGYIGRSKIDFISTQESFEIGWGAHPDIRIHRAERTKKEKTSFLKSKNVKTHTIELYLSNIGEESHTLHCIERIPVSELSQVQVSEPNTKKIKDKVEELKQDKENGFLSWDLKLPPQGNILLSYHYQISKDSSVVEN